jgi:hypothetical protein
MQDKTKFALLLLLLLANAAAKCAFLASTPVQPDERNDMQLSKQNQRCQVPDQGCGLCSYR